MTYYRPTDGEVHNAPIRWRPRTCFVMSAMGRQLPPAVREVRTKVARSLGRHDFTFVDAGAHTTGKDYLRKIWEIAVGCPVGVAIVHDGIRPDTMANIFYELGLLHTYGRDTIVVRVGPVVLPSDFVRTEYINYGRQFSRAMDAFLGALDDRAEYYLTLGDQLRNNPELELDYLRRAFLLTGDKRLQKRATRIRSRFGTIERATGEITPLPVEF